jgi:apolipoprotein N-acyltransferase
VAVSRGTVTSVRAGAVVGAVAVFAAAAAWSAWRPQLAGSGHAVVAGVQPGIVEGPDARFRAHEQATLGLAPVRSDLVVWGESSVGFDPDARPGVVERVATAASAAGADVLVNVDARRGKGGILKTSLLVGPDGARGRYDKMRLVPFGEYIPLRLLLGWVTGLTPAAVEDRRRGVGLDVLRSGRLRVGPLVCFESAFPDLARELAVKGADLVVVQSATTTFQGSWAQAQHASLAAVRAVESGRSVVHTALSGVSAVYDPYGHRLAWLDADRRGIFVARAPVSTGTTPYVRWGDWVPYGSLAVLAGWALSRAVVALRHRRRLVVVGAVPGQLGEEPGDDGHADGAGQPAAHGRDAGSGEGGHGAGLGVAQPGAPRHHRDVGGRHPAAQGVGDVELQDGVAKDG